MLAFYNNQANADFIRRVGCAVGFREEEISYRATFDTASSDIVGSLTVEKKVTIPYGSSNYHFVPGDRLVVLKSHKFQSAELADLCDRNGLDAALHTDDGYAVVRAKKRGD